MFSDPQSLTIGAVARAANVNVETIRFYQRKGLLPPDKPYGGIRRYGPADVARVRFVKSAQRLGFTLDEVADLLRLEDGTHCHDAAASLNTSSAISGRGSRTSRGWNPCYLSWCACHASKGTISCPLIASLQHQSSQA